LIGSDWTLANSARSPPPSQSLLQRRRLVAKQQCVPRLVARSMNKPSANIERGFVKREPDILTLIAKSACTR
jgi:hypothetical protein